MLRKSYKIDNLSVKIYDSRKEMGQAAGKEALEYLKDLLEKQDNVNIVFAAAPSQNEFLETVAQTVDIDWNRVHAFHMDEYVNLPADHPAGFGNFLRKAIFDKVPFGSIEFIGTDTDSDGTIARYDKILSEHHIDIVFMGIGENGHIAFNDPHVADFNDPKRIKKVDLDLKCRTQQVHDGCFSKVDDVPLYALTLTCSQLFSADRLFCVVPAATKADAVKATCLGPITEACPATIMRRHKAATMYLDSDSGKYIL